MIETDLFAEDRAHEELLRALIERMATEEGKEITVRARAARGGHGRALSEFDLYQRTVITRGHLPYLVVVCIDANCSGAAQARRAIFDRVAAEMADRTVIACPDPHVERWYMADPNSFHQVVGYRPATGRRKCERGLYKKILANAVRAGGNPSSLGGIEFAQELARAMDLYRAGRAEPSLNQFLSDARTKIRRL